MTAHRRTASDVKLEINQAIDLTDNDDGSPGGATDETDDIDLIDEDEDEFLNHPLVPNDSYRGMRFFIIQYSIGTKKAGCARTKKNRENDDGIFSQIKVLTANIQ